MKVSKLRIKIIENETSIAQLAEAIGVSRSSLYRKLNSTGRITIGEAIKIKEVLNLSETEASEIFLS